MPGESRQNTVKKKYKKAKAKTHIFYFSFTKSFRALSSLGPYQACDADLLATLPVPAYLRLSTWGSARHLSPAGHCHLSNSFLQKKIRFVFLTLTIFLKIVLFSSADRKNSQIPS